MDSAVKFFSPLRSRRKAAGTAENCRAILGISVSISSILNQRVGLPEGRARPTRFKSLLRLHSLNVVDQICNSLLNLRVVPLVNAGEQPSPNRHVLAPMRGSGGLSADHGSYVG